MDLKLFGSYFCRNQKTLQVLDLRFSTRAGLSLLELFFMHPGLWKASVSSLTTKA